MKMKKEGKMGKLATAKAVGKKPGLALPKLGPASRHNKNAVKLKHS